MAGPRDLEPLTQLDLFRPPTTTPDWEQLPPDARHEAVSMMARTLRPRRRHGRLRPGGRR
jgi:hypothetical protein